MSTRIQWSDIAQAARETSEALNGKDWVNAGFKASVLLADLADEVDRLRAEHVAMGAEVERLRAENDQFREAPATRREVAALHAEMTACDRCGGSLIHTRLKGYRCPRCD